MDRLQAMGVFVKVAETGGFAEASRRLGMSPVTRAIAGLEAAIGARLLTRTTRHVKLTDVGLRYLEDCRRILAELSDAEASAAGSYASPTGVLTVTAPILFGRIYVLPILTDYLVAHPKVDGRALFLDRIANIIEEGIDVAVRIGPLADSDLTAIRCGSVRGGLRRAGLSQDAWQAGGAGRCGAPSGCRGDRFQPVRMAPGA